MVWVQSGSFNKALSDMDREETAKKAKAEKEKKDSDLAREKAEKNRMLQEKYDKEEKRYQEKEAQSKADKEAKEAKEKEKAQKSKTLNRWLNAGKIVAGTGLAVKGYRDTKKNEEYAGAEKGDIIDTLVKHSGAAAKALEGWGKGGAQEGAGVLDKLLSAGGGIAEAESNIHDTTAKDTRQKALNKAQLTENEEMLSKLGDMKALNTVVKNKETKKKRESDERLKSEKIKADTEQRILNRLQKEKQAREQNAFKKAQSEQKQANWQKNYDWREENQWKKNLSKLKIGGLPIGAGISFLAGTNGGNNSINKTINGLRRK